MPTDLLGAGSPQTFSLQKTQDPWKAVTRNAVKWVTLHVPVAVDRGHLQVCAVSVGPCWLLLPGR